MNKAVICEICHRAVTLKHHPNGRRGHIVVGRKASGVQRIVCEQSSCHAEWRRLGDAIRATWPENAGKREMVVVKDIVTGQERQAPVQSETPRPDPFAPLVASKEAPMQEAKPVQIEIARRRKTFHSVELMEWAVDWVRKHAARKGTFISLSRYVLREKQEWVRLGDGSLASEKAIAEQIRRACIAAGVWSVRGPVPVETESRLALVGQASHMKPEHTANIIAGEEPKPESLGGDPARTRRYAQFLVAEVLQGLSKLAERGDLVALETILAMVEEEAERG